MRKNGRRVTSRRVGGKLQGVIYDSAHDVDLADVFDTTHMIDESMT